jgi:hypothetical protein
VIAGNVRVRRTETLEQGLRRTMLEHRMGYDGLSIVLGHSSGIPGRRDLHTPAFKKWQELSEQIPQGDRDALVTDPQYAHLKGDKEALNLVWFAREAAKDPAFASKTRPPFFREMWEVFCDRVALLLEKAGLRKPEMRNMRDPAFLTDVREFVQLAHDAVVVNRRGQTPRVVTTSIKTGRTGRPIALSLLPDGPMPEDTAARITSIWKPHRPETGSYISPKQEKEHLAQFENGVARIMTADALKKYGPGQKDGTSFVLPQWQLNEVLDYAKGDRGRLEDALGLQRGELGSAPLVLVTIPHPDKYNLRLPSGNEAGANQKWIPGGRLPKKASAKGIREAIIDLGGVPEGAGWTKTPLGL